MEGRSGSPDVTQGMVGMRNVIRHGGWGSSLNRLSRILAKTGCCTSCKDHGEAQGQGLVEKGSGDAE